MTLAIVTIGQEVKYLHLHFPDATAKSINGIIDLIR
jgi:hypothetical protein